MRDKAEFETFYVASVAQVTTQVYAMIGDLSEAEDAVQEAYGRAWSRWRRISAYENPVAWVRTVAYRIAVSSWRRARNRLAAQIRGMPLQQAPPLSPDTVALIDALRRISASQRRAIVLHYLAGMTVKEIAVETTASVSAVKAQLSRGRQALAQLLRLDEPVEVQQHA